MNIEKTLQQKKNILFLVQSRACSDNVAKAALSLMSDDVGRADRFLREITTPQLGELVERLEGLTGDIENEILDGWFIPDLVEYLTE